MLSLNPESGRLEFESNEVGGKTSTLDASNVLIAGQGAIRRGASTSWPRRAGRAVETYVGYWYKEVERPSAQETSQLAPETTHIWPRTDGLLCLFPNLDRSFTGSLFMPFEGSGNSFGSLATQADLRALFNTRVPQTSLRWRRSWATASWPHRFPQSCRSGTRSQYGGDATP